MPMIARGGLLDSGSIQDDPLDTQCQWSARYLSDLSRRQARVNEQLRVKVWLVNGAKT